MYLLDTNIISQLIRQPDGPVAQRLRREAPEQLLTSVIVQAELRFGYTKSGVLRQKVAVEAVLQQLRIEDWCQPADVAYAQLRTVLEKAGSPIGQNDMLIAAHALTLGKVLVTDNAREFSRVAGLKVENWLRS
jgi:tRNA(fMet)-specific endonuclease VapC